MKPQWRVSTCFREEKSASGGPSPAAAQGKVLYWKKKRGDVANWNAQESFVERKKLLSELVSLRKGSTSKGTVRRKCTGNNLSLIVIINISV